MEAVRKVMYAKLCTFERKVYEGEINGGQHEDVLMNMYEEAAKAGVARSDFDQLCANAYHAMKPRSVPNYLMENGRYHVQRSFIIRLYASFAATK